MEFLAFIFIITMVRFLLHFFGWFWNKHELKFAKNVAFRCLYPRELILYARWSITIMISLFKNTGKDHKGTQLWAMKYVVCHGLINTVSFHTVSVHKWTLPLQENYTSFDINVVMMRGGPNMVFNENPTKNWKLRGLKLRGLRQNQISALIFRYQIDRNNKDNSHGTSWQ